MIRPARRQRRFGTKLALGVMVLMVMMATVRVLAVMLRCEGRTRKDQQQQDGGKNLLHGENVPRAGRLRKSPARPASNKERVSAET